MSMNESQNEIRIRVADASDVEALVDFNHAMAIETEAKELDRDLLTAGVKGLLSKKQFGFYLIAEDSSAGRIASLMVTYEWSDWRNGLFWWIQSVYVKPEFRRRGIYRRLYEFVKEMAKDETDVCGFRLYVEKENAVAQQTYEQLGMKQTQYAMYEELVG
jgi:ribosomal protein S18 acetylase RimI-like enzyme